MKQQAWSEIDDLKRKLEALEARVAALENRPRSAEPPRPYEPLTNLVQVGPGQYRYKQDGE